MATANIVGDMQLVRDQAGTLAAQPAPRHTVLFTLIFTRAITQRETVHTVDLPGEQAVLRFAKDQFAVEKDLAQHDVGFLRIQARTGIGEQTVFFFYVFNSQLPAFVAGYRIARIKHDACNGGIAACIQTIFSRRGKKQSDGSRIHRYDCTQSEFAFRVAYPALTKCKGHKLNSISQIAGNSSSPPENQADG